MKSDEVYQAKPVYLKTLSKEEREELLEEYKAFKLQEAMEDANIVHADTSVPTKSGARIGCIGALVLALSIPVGLGYVHSKEHARVEIPVKVEGGRQP